MSHKRDTLTERNVECRQSTAQLSTSQPFQSKSSLSNKKKEKVAQNVASKNSPKHLSKSKQNEPQVKSEMGTQVFTNLSVDQNLSTQCQNLSINSDSDSVNQEHTLQNPKRKNDKKKERLKQLKIPAVSGSSNMMLTSQIPIQMSQAYIGQNYVSSVHELFAKQISPLYANNSSRYLENLLHHPHFLHMHHMQQALSIHQYCQHAVSVPNTPLLRSLQRPASASIPNSPAAHSESSSSTFLQNMMQHPMLKINAGKKFSPKYTRNKNKEHSNGNLSFDSYLTVEEVDSGLKNNILIEGVLRINPKQYQHSYVSSNDRSEQDILIDGLKNRNRALEGDVVIVQLIDSDNEENNDDNKLKKGKVVYIKEEVHTRTCIGTLKIMPDKTRENALFVPRDHRIPRLMVPFIFCPDGFFQDVNSYKDTLLLAKILSWTDIRFASGKILCLIGQSGDMVTETKAILAQTDLDVTPFGPEIRDLYPRLDYVIPDEEIKLREDCRNLCTFSIDPFNCRDIDDAISCRELENGNYEIGVHISDVAHFLTENTVLDEKVAEKATTIYLVEKAYHMLPDELCMLCSLFPGVDKLAFSVFWEITKDAKVLSHRFSKTVINSCGQLAYDHAQAILEDREDAKAIFPETYNGFQYEDVLKTIKVVGGIATIFRRNRFESGALRIDQPKVAFHLNAINGLPDSFWIYESKESHQLIEEFMLLANMTVANRIHADHPKLAFLRCHPHPSGYMMKQLAKSLKPIGIELDISSAGAVHRSLLPHVSPENTDKGKAMVLNMLCAKPMTRAKYFCADGCADEDFCHYALNVPLYTHFTSPIRRYADIMVHRLLAASLNYREAPKWEINKVQMIAAQCNKQKYNAKKAGELSTELYTLKYIEMNSPLETEAVVVEVREKYIDVIITAMGLNRRIFFNNDFAEEYRCIKHEGGVKLSKMEITWRAVDDMPQTIQVIQVFSILQVQLHREDNMVKVETKLVRPKQTIVSR